MSQYMDQGSPTPHSKLKSAWGTFQHKFALKIGGKKFFWEAFPSKNVVCRKKCMKNPAPRGFSCIFFCTQHFLKGNSSKMIDCEIQRNCTPGNSETDSSLDPYIGEILRQNLEKSCNHFPIFSSKIGPKTQKMWKKSRKARFFPHFLSFWSNFA